MALEGSDLPCRTETIWRPWNAQTVGYRPSDVFGHRPGY